MAYWGAGIMHELGHPEFGGASLAALTRKRHGGRWNMLFCDGHLERAKAKDLFDIRDQEVRKRWNRDNDPHSDLDLKIDSLWD